MWRITHASLTGPWGAQIILGKPLLVVCVVCAAVFLDKDRVNNQSQDAG